jgi:hypothetical protein
MSLPKSIADVYFANCLFPHKCHDFTAADTPQHCDDALCVCTLCLGSWTRSYSGQLITNWNFCFLVKLHIGIFGGLCMCFLAGDEGSDNSGSGKGGMKGVKRCKASNNGSDLSCLAPMPLIASAGTQGHAYWL